MAWSPQVKHAEIIRCTFHSAQHLIISKLHSSWFDCCSISNCSILCALYQRNRIFFSIFMSADGNETDLNMKWTHLFYTSRIWSVQAVIKRRKKECALKRKHDAQCVHSCGLCLSWQFHKHSLYLTYCNDNELSEKR